MRRSELKLALVLCVLTMCAQPATSSSAAVGDSSATSKVVKQVNAYLQPQVDTHSFSGSVLISKGRTVLLDKGYGKADEKNRIPDGPNTVFPIESLTKAFTAVALLQLQEQGKLTVKDHLCRFIAHCPQNWNAITVEQLLTMTSGLPDYSFIPDEDMSSPAKAFAYLGQEKPLTRPGATWAYNSFSYDFLGYILQKLSGMTYWAYIRKHVFQPLGMKHSGFISNLATTPNHALSYHGSDTAHPIPLNIQCCLSPAMSFLDADASITSTVSDLGRWSRALDTTQLLSKADVHAMFSPHIQTTGPGSTTTFAASYGYGWFIGRIYNHLVEQHRGGGHLDWGYLFRFPDRHISVIVLCNRPDADGDTILTNLSRIVLTSGV